MQIMFGTILCVLLKDLVLTKAIITFIPKDYTPSNSLQEENVSICPNLNFTQDISIFEKSDHHILNFKSDRSHSDSTVRNKREDDEVTNTNVSIIPESIESSLSKPTSLRAFVQFNSQFAEKVNDIFVTLRWNQPEFINEIIQGYTVQCFFIEDLKEIQTCDDKNIITTKLEHTVHNLISNTIYYFRVRAHTKIVAGPYTDLINVSTTHENSIPKLLVITKHDMVILDVDSSITNVVMSESVIEYSSSFSRSATYVAYSIQERRIYWITGSDLMTLKINENNITKIASFDYYPHDLCIDWVGRNLYIAYRKLDYSYIVSFDLTMWENGIIKFDEIFKSKMNILRLSVSMGILYSLHNSTNGVFYMTQYPIDRKNIQIQINASVCLFHYSEYNFRDMIIDNMNNEESLIYWLNNWDIVVTDVNISMCNGILHNTEGVVKSGCKEYNLPTIIYTISVSCLDNNLNKSEKFEVLTAERYYEIQNLTPFTEYKLKYTLSNFYFDQLSINPFDSNVISMKTNSGKLNAPENVSALALKPTIAVVHWMPLKKVNCVAATYEVHWKSVTLANGTQQKGKQFINMPKRTADGRFFTKIHLSLPIQDYLIYVRVYPNNFSDFYNESLSKIDHIYSDPNNITLSEVEINSMDISWISNINLTISPTLEYKENATEKWQTTNYIKINYNKEIIYHIENLQSGTLYKFRLILRYPEYEENFIWPADERFIFSTLDISGTPGIIAKKYYLILMLGFIVIVTIICVCYFYRLHRERRYNNEQFLSSTDMELAILDEVSCQYTEFNTIYSPMLHCNPDECAITKIARKQITFTKLLGSGAFGMVFQGKVKNLEGSSTEISVAIKTLRKDASSREKKNLLKEAKLMNHFRHKHILRLLAVCLDGDSPLLVLELMETGDLLKYLRDCRNLQASDSPALRLQDLLAMCEDVARGCCYLEELRFVHRDLACRNCLVSSKNRENRVIKIGDFGLARDIYKGDYYRVKGQGLLPIRWMAPESLMIRIFTSQSDVWSFGVLMWEITSLGEQPYIAKTDEEVINYVRAGGRLPIALNCPSPLYQLMLRCWSAADARPNFKFCLENIIALRKNIEDTLLNPVDTI